jgi:hypothetical protein
MMVMKTENILCKIVSIFPSASSILQTVLAKNVKLLIAVDYKHINKLYNFLLVLKITGTVQAKVFEVVSNNFQVLEVEILN